MLINLLKNHILIEIKEQEESKTESGIYIPKESNIKKNTGIVSIIGQEVKQIKVGDRVLIKKYGFEEIEIEGTKYLIGAEGDILAILEK